ncbi:MAG: alanyl-tRNA editing protein [Burkholderiaceae bacterium]
MATEALYQQDAYLQETPAVVTAVSEAGIELDRSVFYPRGGGQAGDSGVLMRADGSEIIIDNTIRQKGEPQSILHVPAGDAALPAVGEAVSVRLDWERRYRHMRIHTCLHVLSCVVVAPVTGGNISAEKGRLDFDIEMSQLDAARIEAGVNELISKAVDTETVWITDEELDAQPELVKTMSVQPPRGAGRVRLLKIDGIDLQPCGGTHVRNTREIGPVKVLKIRSEGKRNKRVEIGLV